MVREEVFDLSEVDIVDDEPDFAHEHARITTSEQVASGKDTHGDAVPHGLGGMDMKRLRLLD